jgi:hypothetical protein
MPEMLNGAQTILDGASRALRTAIPGSPTTRRESRYQELSVLTRYTKISSF